MPIKRRDLRRALMRKFHFEEIHKTKHDSYELLYREKKIAITYLSRGHREVHDSILKQMANQIGVSLNTFKGMVGCTIEYEEYLSTLYQREPDRFE